jgi:hypothetical protein
VSFVVANSLYGYSGPAANKVKPALDFVAKRKSCVFFAVIAGGAGRHKRLALCFLAAFLLSCRKLTDIESSTSGRNCVVAHPFKLSQGFSVTRSCNHGSWNSAVAAGRADPHHPVAGDVLAPLKK